MASDFSEQLAKDSSVLWNQGYNWPELVQSTELFSGEIIHLASLKLCCLQIWKWKAAMTAFIAMKQCQFIKMRIEPLKKNNLIYHHLTVTSLFCSNAKVCEVLNKSKWGIMAVKTTQGQWRTEPKSEGERLHERHEALKQWGKTEE